MRMKEIPFLHRLRIIATVAVVLMHVTSKEFFVPATDSLQWQILNVFNGMTHWAVPVFVMISGTLFLDPEREVPIQRLFGRNILKLVVALVFWSAAYAVTYSGIYLHESPRDILEYFLQGHVHLWYLPMLIGLYLLVPLLRKITASLPAAEYFLILTAVFSILVPELGRWEILPKLRGQFSRMDMHFCLGYSGYFVAGYVLRKTGIKKRVRIGLYVVAGLATAAAIIHAGMKSAQLGRVANDMYGAFSTGTVLQSFAVFTAFQYGCDHRPCSAFTKKLSEATFGIYLIHELWIDFLRRFCGLSAISFQPALAVPLTTVLVLAGAAVSALLLRKVEFFRRTIV